MTVVLRNVPPGYNWGWFSREDQRMHLQVVDRKHHELGYKVWLEERGKRIFQPAGEIPAKLLKRLQAEVAKRREHIEYQWTGLMLDNRWISQSLHGSVITLTGYPAVPGSRFTRHVDLADYLRGIYDPDSPLVEREKKPVRAEEVTLSDEIIAIEIWPQRPESRRYHIFLPPLLWQD